MQVTENKQIKEKLYTEKLDNGLILMVFPKKTRKKYIVWSTNFGAVDNKFYAPGEENLTVVPDGIAHYLEHKLFEQENGKNSLDVLTSIGVDANAYTTNDHTAYLYECTEHFDDALDEFMNYVQNPYFTDENVEKETEDFMQYMVLSGVIQSAEFMTLNKKVTGIRKFRRNWKKNRHYRRAQILRLQVQSVKAKCFGSLVIPIWVKMPNSIRNIVRRITGRKRKPE